MVEQRAAAWAAAGKATTFRAAFNQAIKLGMRHNEARLSDDSSRSSLQRRVLETLAAAYLPLVPGLRHAANCVMPLWACAKVGYWEDGLAAALVGRLAQNGGELLQRAMGQDHGLAWWSLSEAPRAFLTASTAAGVLDVSGDILLEMDASDLNSQACANVLLAAARLQRGAPPLLHRITACLAAMASSAKCQELANALYALGKLADECEHTPRREDLQRLAREVAARLGGNAAADQAFKPQELSNMLWGCAKLGYSDSALLRPLATAVVRAAGRMGPQGLANSLYALALLGYARDEDEPVLQPLAAAAGQAAGRMKPQELSNTLYALALMGCTGAAYATALKALVDATAGRLHERPEEFAAQGLSNTLWATAVLQPPGCQARIAAAAAECQRRGFTGFQAQHISNATWALAKLGYADQSVYAAAVEAALQPSYMSASVAQDHSNLLYALALVRHRPPAALLAGMADAQHLRTQAGAQHCANSLWALAILYGCIEEDDADQAAVLRLLHVLAGRLGQLLRQPGQQPQEQELANSLWALAVMGPVVLSRHSGLVEELLREVVRRWELVEGGACLKDEELAQLWQVHLEVAHAGGACTQLSGLLAGTESLLGAARDAAEAERREPDPTISSLQVQVLSALSRLQQAPRPAGSGPAILSVQEEHWVAELCCRVDAVVELAGGRRVAVEVDGPNHFLASHPHTRVKDGSTQLRDRQLGRVFGQGNVLSVPYWEWNGLGAASERETYLQGLLL